MLSMSFIRNFNGIRFYAAVDPQYLLRLGNTTAPEYLRIPLVTLLIKIIIQN